MDHPLRFGIIGTGWIGGVVATSISKSKQAKLTAICDRELGIAQAFAATRPGVEAVDGVKALLAREDVDAVHVATPTAAKLDIALAAIAAGKHVLVDKPLMDHSWVEQMTEAASAKGVLFMDATHFVHHPRTKAIREAIPALIGRPRSLHTTFYFPVTDRTNVRFDPTQEPNGAAGDQVWYPMRAVVEYLQPQGAPAEAAAVAERDSETGAIISVSGMIGFESGEVSTFDAGYTGGTVIMELSLLGTSGMITVDDFLLDWTNSFAFDNPGIKTGYTHRTGMATRNDFTFIETPSDVPADVLMIDHFTELAISGDRRAAAPYAAASLKTQQCLDAIWQALQ